jgi:GNAT superfamily N-acetyltransferase
MEVIEFKDKEGMLEHFSLIQEMYPDITFEEYSAELDEMIPHKYGQIGIYENGECLGLSGYWFGTKLWCGKYLECDNVIVSEKHRNKGVGELLFSALKEKAQQLGCTMLALDSYTDNFKAHKFFYQQGYIPRGFHFINILDKSKIR